MSEYNIEQIVEGFYNKTTCSNRAAKFWATFAKAHEVDIEVFDEEGNANEYWMILDDIIDTNELDESNLVDYLIQPQFKDLDEHSYDYVGGESIVVVSLNQLMEAFDNEDQYKLRQFEITPTRVHRITDEVIKHSRLFEPIELAYVNNVEQDLLDVNPVILSGRHRAVALITLFRKIKDWNELQLYVKVRRFNTESELAQHIQSRNGSRGMTEQEKTGLWFAGSGTDPHDNEEVFSRVAEGLAVLPKVFETYFINVLDEEDLGITRATAGLLGKKIASNLKSKKVLSSKVTKFLKVPETAKRIAETAEAAIVDNWNVLKDRCKVVQTDDEGNQVVTFNISRNIDKIAVPVARQLGEAFQQELEESLVKSEAEREAKARKRKETAAQKEQQKLSDAIKILKEAGIPVDDNTAKKLANVRS